MQDNVSSLMSHLTNYTLNKNNAKFVFAQDEENDDEGNKWTLRVRFCSLRLF